MDAFCPAYATNQNEITIPIFQCQTDHLEAPFNYNELITAIKSKKKNTAPRLDDISYIMIKNLTNISLELLLNIFNNIWTKKTNSLLEI